MAEELDAGGGLPGGLPGDRRLFLIAAVAVVLILIVIFSVVRSCGTIRRGPSYVLLYSHLELKDTANVVTKLKDLRIPYEIRDEGTSIAVLKDKADEARLALAEENLPHGGLVGWEIFDETKLGATDFDRRIQFIRAISGELARTIRHIDAIEDARVQIVIPETRLFEVAKAPVTASVLLRLKPAEKLSGPQINGIVNLVASSVENLKPANITVIDIYGNILTPVSYAGAPITTIPRTFVPETMDEEQLKEIAKVKAKEEELKEKEMELNKKEADLKKIAEMELLSDAGNIISEEDLKRKVIEEEKSPKALTEEEKALLRLKMKKEIDAQLSEKAQIVLNKFYPPNTAIVNVNVEMGTPKIEYFPETAKLSNGSKKKVSLKAKEVVTVRRMTAIILVDKKLDLTQTLKKDTYSSVAGAIGYDRLRGDKIIMRKVPFRLAEAPIVKSGPEQKQKGISLPFKLNVDFKNIKASLLKLYDKISSLPWLKKSLTAISTSKHIRNVIYGIIGFFVLIFVLRRIFRSKSEDEYEESFEENVDRAASSKPRAGEEKKASLDEVRRSASANPEKMANLLKSWLSEEAA